MSAKELCSLSILENEAARTDLAHELHDSVNPLLCVAKLYMEQLLPSTEKDIQAKKQVMELLSSAIQSVKQVSESNSIFQKQDLSVVELIKSFIGKIAALGTVAISSSFSGIGQLNSLHSSYKLTIYRIIQEQLNNIMKYSKAKNVRIQVMALRNKLVLKISDDGVGFDLKKIKTGIGIVSMERRIQQLGGVFELDSSYGHGCRIVVSFNLAD